MGSDQPSPPPTSGPPFLSPLRVIATICIVAPFVAVLWIPSYNKTNPKLLGFPFFYWYQLLWVIITAVLMAIAFQVMKRDQAARRGQRAAGVAPDGPDADPAGTAGDDA